MKPSKITKISPSELLIMWDNGHESRYTLEFLRDHCPCASCSGETVLLRSYQPPAADRTTPGRYSLVGITTVGSYAVQLQWADGHNTGIYSWEKLWNDCPCGEHEPEQ